MLEVGSQVKDFTLLDDEGNEFNLFDNLSDKTVIYFYPKDDTPGCTTQACEFRDNYHRFKELDIQIIGVSPDNVESHQAFKAKHELPFKLLADPEMKVINQFGAYGDKNLYGRITKGIKRSTFIINKEGIVEKVYKRAIPAKNAHQIIEYLTK